MTQARLRGEVQVRPLAGIRANDWNPNVMTLAMKESLKKGLAEDGWLVSQALLIWGTDDDGNAKNIVIDGEHRLVAASELGFERGPMVVLDGLPEAEAKKLTIKLNQKRGDWDLELLGKLLRSLEEDDRDGAELGFSDEEILRLTAVPPEKLPDPERAPRNTTEATPGEGLYTPPVPEVETRQTHQVNLFFDDVQHGRFLAVIASLEKRHTAPNMSDLILTALEAHDVEISD